MSHKFKFRTCNDFEVRYHKGGKLTQFLSAIDER